MATDQPPYDSTAFEGRPVGKAAAGLAKGNLADALWALAEDARRRRRDGHSAAVQAFAAAVLLRHLRNRDLALEGAEPRDVAPPSRDADPSSSGERVRWGASLWDLLLEENEPDVDAVASLLDLGLQDQAFSGDYVVALQRKAEELDPTLLAASLHIVDVVGLDTPAARERLEHALSRAVYTSDLDEDLGEAALGTRYAAFLATLARPKPGEVVLDLRAGFGAVPLYLLRRLEYDHPGATLDLQAIEPEDLPLLVSAALLVLAGHEPDGLLGAPAASLEQASAYDCVVAHVSPSQPYNGTPEADPALHVVKTALAHLKPGGRAVLTVPEPLLSSGGPYRELRERLVEDYALDAVFSFPSLGNVEGAGLATLCVSARPAHRSVWMVGPEVVRLATSGVVPSVSHPFYGAMDAVAAGLAFRRGQITSEDLVHQYDEAVRALEGKWTHNPDELALLDLTLDSASEFARTGNYRLLENPPYGMPWSHEAQWTVVAGSIARSLLAPSDPARSSVARYIHIHSHPVDGPSPQPGPGAVRVGLARLRRNDLDLAPRHQPLLRPADFDLDEAAERLQERLRTLEEPEKAALAWAVAILLHWLNGRNVRPRGTAPDGDRTRPPLPSPLRWEALVAEPEPDLEAAAAAAQRAANSSDDPLMAGLARIDLGTLPPDELGRALRIVDLLRTEKTEKREVLEAIFEVAQDATLGRIIHSGGYTTPRPVADLLAVLTAPQPGDTLFDPCFGFGTTLAAAVRAAVAADTEARDSATTDGSSAPSASGTDVNPDALPFAAARVILAGGDPSRLRVADALATPAAPSEAKPDCDVAVVDPPLGLRLEEPYAGPLGDTTNGEVAFLQTALSHLKPGGRAAVVVPATLLGNPALEPSRRALLERYAVDAVISLPASSFADNTVEVAVLCVHDGAPHDEVWFVESSVVASALQDERALAALALGVAYRRGDVSEADLREAARQAPSTFDLTEWHASFEEALDALPEEPEKRALRLWSHVSAVVADALLPGGWYDETLHESPADGVSWRVPLEWLLQHGSTLTVRQTGAREIEDLLDRATFEDPDAAAKRSLSEVAEVLRGVRPAAEHLGLAAEVPAGTPFVRVGDLQDGEIGKPSLVLRSGLDPDALRTRPDEAVRVEAGDLLVSLAGEVGKVAVVPPSLDGAVPSGELAVVRPRRGVLPGYLVALLWTVPYQRWMAGHAGGSTVQILSIRDLRVLPVLLPSEDDQRRLIAGLRPGYESGSILALLANTEENRFAVAITTEPLLSDLDGVPVEDPTDEALLRAGLLQSRLWDIALETGAMSYAPGVTLDPNEGVVEKAPSGKPNAFSTDPFAEWIVEAHSAFMRVADALDMFGGAERLVAIDLALADLRDATRRMRAGRTRMDEEADPTSAITVKAGLLFPARIPNTDEALGSPTQRAAADRASSAVMFVERVLRSARSVLLSGENVRLEVRVEPEVIEVDRATDLLVTVTNTTPVTLRWVDVDVHLPEPGGAVHHPDAVSANPFVEPGDEEAVRIAGAVLFSQGEEISGILRLPPQTAAGPRTLRVEVTFTHLDDVEHVVSLPIRVSVRDPHESVLASAADLGPSPYVIGDPVREPSMFFGRRGVLERIYDQVARPSQANLVLLEGNRRTGKSSILAQLKRDPSARLDGWIVADCSFQEGKGDAERPGLPTREVFYRIARNVAIAIEQAGHPVELPGPPLEDKLFSTKVRKSLTPFFDEAGDDAADALRELLSLWLDGAGDARLLLLLDEFDKLDEGIRNGVTSPQVPENLRALFQQEARVSAVLAVFPRITRLRQSYWDALFGLGVKVPLGPLEPDEALALIQEPVQNRLTYEGEAAVYLAGQCGRQPYLMQVLADKVFANRAAERRRDVPVSVVEHAARSLAEDSEHFHGLWQVAGPNRRRLLLSLVYRLNEGPKPVTLGLLEDALEGAGVRLPENEQLGSDHLDALRELELVRLEAAAGGAATYVPTLPLMGRWIRRHTDPDDLRARAVAELSS